MSLLPRLIGPIGLLCVWLWCVSGQRAGADEPAARYGLLVRGQFLHVPGPNPVLLPGAPGAWDEGVIEAADALRDGDTYYLYYHGTGQGKGYRLGVATASGPLGPFRKHGDKPILDLGPPGTWDDRNVACAMVLKEGPGNYLMWYSATGSSPQHARWSIGLAAACHPLGPWKKHAGNPVLVDFGYVGGVVKTQGKFYLYTAHPIGSTGPDYSPMALALADSPAGPWTRWPKNPVLNEGPKGTWDHGGFSEAEVFHAGGQFHMFYGGATIHSERIRSQESIGYAFSFDGHTFMKHPQNPVARREDCPNAAAFAEVHAIHEPPFVYLYHTLRYRSPRTVADEKKFPVVENLGIEVLVTARPFELDMPVIHQAALSPGQTTPAADSPPVSMSGMRRASVTAQCLHAPKATRSLRIHVLESADGLQWKPGRILQCDGLSHGDRASQADRHPAGSTQKTFPLLLGPRWIKLLAENPDPCETVSNLAVNVHLGG